MARIKCPKCDFINEEGRPTCSRCGNTLPQVKIQAVAPAPPPEHRHPQMNQIQFHRGQVVAGRYTVLNMIGRGGMGCIYHVRDNALHEEVALKTLLPQFVRDKMVVERFFNEARIARALSHPNIVRVHDIGVTGDIIYISMELIRGKSLRSMLENSVTEDYIPFKQALQITDQLCAALEYAHRHTVHRDIKPENVMVCDDGTVKLMDFGISKLMDSSRLTGTSIIMGTPMYMSPEQLRNSANVDARADIYSIGVMLYELLTGNLPTSLSKPASQITHGVPSAVDSIVAKCVEPDPEKRFQSAAELRAALDQFVADGRPAQTRRTRAGTLAGATDELAEPRPWGRRILGGVLIAIIAALTAAGFYTLELVRQTKLEQAQAPPETGMFEQVTNLREHLRTLLSEAAGTDKFAADVLTAADAAWQGVKAADADDPAAVESMTTALQAYVGLFVTPQGMVFVPPGNAFAGVDVGPFFIDAAEVTLKEYEQFCTDKQWLMPGMYDFSSSSPDIPILGVTFYDALAYAASKNKSLPTEAQWARAACGGAGMLYPWAENAWREGGANTADGKDAESQYPSAVKSFPADKSWAGCYDMLGNVAEWTRTIYSDGPYDVSLENLADIYFGSQLAVRGGSYRQEAATLQTRGACLFENSAENIGFRCVQEMPNDLQKMIALAKQALAGR